MNALELLNFRLQDFCCTKSRFARALGVSQPTVSLALSGRTRMSLNRFLLWSRALALQVHILDGEQAMTLNDWVATKPLLLNRNVIAQSVLDDLEAWGYRVEASGIPAGPDGTPAWLPGVRM